MVHIRNPGEWGADELKRVGDAVKSTGRAVQGQEESGTPKIRQLASDDLKQVLKQGLDDFAVYRSDVVFICLIYPVIGLFLTRMTFQYDLLPLLFPFVCGFALLGPLAAIGLYEMSRRREKGEKASWVDAFSVVNTPSFGAIAVLGAILLTIFLVWLGVAQLIYWLTLGPEPPESIVGFLRDTFSTGAGWAMIIAGSAIGILFAFLVLAISVVSFPMLLDRDVGLVTAIETSIRVVRQNPQTMTLWGIIVAAGLVIGSIPLFLGLIVIMPILGHATWHLYRQAVEY